MQKFVKFEEGLIGISMMVVVVVLSVNIILRFFFSSGITWAEELIRYTIIYITFIGGAVCFRKGIHVGVDILFDSLPEKGQKILQIIINIFAMIFMILLIKYGMDLVLFSMGTNQLAPAMGIKIYWAYLAIPLGSFLSLIHLLIRTYRIILNKEVEDEREGVH